MALKIEQAFGYEEEFLRLLQTYYEIAEYKNSQKSRAISGTPAIRRSLFRNTDFDTLDWKRYRVSVIARVLERGNDTEKAEIARFYRTTNVTLVVLGLCDRERNQSSSRHYSESYNWSCRSKTAAKRSCSPFAIPSRVDIDCHSLIAASTSQMIC